MILYINTTEFNLAVFGVEKDRIIKKSSYKLKQHEGYKVLSKFESFLKKYKIKQSDISQIITNKGPGSFVGTRVGVTIAQALGFAWQAPVKFLSKEKFNNRFSEQKK